MHAAAIPREITLLPSRLLGLNPLGHTCESQNPTPDSRPCDAAIPWLSSIDLRGDIVTFLYPTNEGLFRQQQLTIMIIIPQALLPDSDSVPPSLLPSKRFVPKRLIAWKLCSSMVNEKLFYHYESGSASLPTFQQPDHGSQRSQCPA
jgi:hypothetical protein